MKIGIFSDTHANAHATTQCLTLFDTFCTEKVFHLGDAVGYYPDADAVVDLLEKKGAVCLRGNHEAMLFGDIQVRQDAAPIYRLNNCREKLKEDFLERMKWWPSMIEQQIDGRKLLFVHGSPWNSTSEYIYPDADLGRFESLSHDAIFMGHTHRPFLSVVGKTKIVNVGSCGLPRDQGDLGSCAIYDTLTGRCEIIRFRLDVKKIIEQYGRTTDKLVIDCLRRESYNEFFGIIAEKI